MSTLPEEDIPMPDDDEIQKSFEAGCMRVAVVYLLLYFSVGLLSTVFSISTGTHWWVLGWGWPFFITLAMMVGVNLGAWGDRQ